MAEKKKSFWERNKERNQAALDRTEVLQKAKEEGRDVTNPEVNKKVQESVEKPEPKANTGTEKKSFWERNKERNQAALDRTEVLQKAKEEGGEDITNPEVDKKVQESVEKPEATEKPTVKTEPAVEKPVEEPANVTDTNATDTSVEATSDAIKKDIESSGILDTDEGQEAQAAIDSNKPEMLMNIVSPEGESVLKGSYDENGNYVPYTYTEADTRLVKNPGLAGALTIVSYALSALGVMAGVPILPVNFYKFGAAPQEDLNRLQSVENGYAELMNAGKAKATETERTRAAERGANVADIDTYKNISDEGAQRAARVNAAVGGSNTQMDVQGQAQEWQAKQAQLDRDFQEKMANINTENTIAIVNANAANQQEMARLLNDQEVQKIVKKIAYAKEAGLSQDELAKWLRAEQGITKLAAGLGYVNEGADAASKIAGMFMPKGTSDKSVKKYVARNNDMLRKAWGGKK